MSKGEIPERLPEILTESCDSTCTPKSLPWSGAFLAYTHNTWFKHLVHLIEKNLGKFSLLPSRHDCYLPSCYLSKKFRKNGFEPLERPCMASLESTQERISQERWGEDSSQSLQSCSLPDTHLLRPHVGPHSGAPKLGELLPTFSLKRFCLLPLAPFLPRHSHPLPTHTPRSPPQW